MSLVRDGYESAFEEIFRRYGASLRSYAASIVTAQRADDVTQEAFTKAYLALRGSDKEIQLRPWLYRIVRNTALTDIRDEPKPGKELEDADSATVGPEELAAQREEINRLMAGLRKLPEPQRAAIVMRELEGLSHDQIAASLGLSGGAVRQSIYRARRTLREGIGMLLPMPVLRVLLEEGFGQGISATAAGGGAGIAVKTGIAALLAAGTVTAGAVFNDDLKSPPEADATPAKTAGGGGSAAVKVASDDRTGSGVERGDDRDGGRDGGGSGDDSGRSRKGGPGSLNSGESSGSSGSDDSGSGSSGSGSSGSGSSGSGSDDLLSVSSGSGSSGSGSSGSGSDDFLSGSSESGSSGSGSGSGGSGSNGSDNPLD